MRIPQARWAKRRERAETRGRRRGRGSRMARRDDSSLAKRPSRTRGAQPSRLLGPAGTSTACSCKVASGTISRARSWVEARTT